MKLYYAKGACSLAPHIILEELGDPYETQSVDLMHGENEKPEYHRINALEAVPTLQLDDGQLLTEAAVVLQYLADRKPELNLAPRPGTMERYRLMEWLNFIATEIHKGFGPLFYIDRMVKDPGALEQLRAGVIDDIGAGMEVITERLGSREYLLPSGYSVADAYLSVIMSWSRFLKVDLSRWPAATALQGRVMSRPAAQRALKAEGLLSKG